MAKVEKGSYPRDGIVRCVLKLLPGDDYLLLLVTKNTNGIVLDGEDLFFF